MFIYKIILLSSIALTINSIEISKNNYSNNFLENLVKLINKGYKPIDYKQNESCPINMNFTLTNTSHNDIYLCDLEYSYKILKPINLEYIPFEILKLIIRDINYDDLILFAEQNFKRKNKLKFIRFINKNYGRITERNEIKYMNNVCSIEYDNLDVNQIKMKVDRFIEKNKKYYSTLGYLENITYILKLLLGLIILSIFQVF